MGLCHGNKFPSLPPREGLDYVCTGSLVPEKSQALFAALDGDSGLILAGEETPRETFHFDGFATQARDFRPLT